MLPYTVDEGDEAGHSLVNPPAAETAYLMHLSSRILLCY